MNPQFTTQALNDLLDKYGTAAGVARGKNGQFYSVSDAAKGTRRTKISPRNAYTRLSMQPLLEDCDKEYASAADYRMRAGR